MTKQTGGSDQVIRIPLTGVLALALATVLLGMIGGLVGAQIWHPQLPPLSNGGDNSKLVATVQEVKISPNLARAAVIANARRSVLLLQKDGRDFFAAGTILTNDGLIVTSAAAGEQAQVTGYDSEGRTVKLALIGTDVLYGLTYYQADNNVLVPFDLKDSETTPGQNLVALGLNSISFQPNAAEFLVNDFILPDGQAAAIQQVIKGTLKGTPAAAAPLVDEDGKVAGIMIDAAHGLALPVSELKASFSRAAAGKLAQDIFADLGLSVQYGYTALPTQGVRFNATATSVKPDSLAAKAGLKRNDIITKIGSTDLTPTVSAAGLLAGNLPLNLAAVRDLAPLNIVLQPAE